MAALTQQGSSILRPNVFTVGTGTSRDMLCGLCALRYVRLHGDVKTHVYCFKCCHGVGKVDPQALLHLEGRN